jgi:hypothetical protein
MQNCHFINFDITIRGTEAPYTVMAHFTGNVAEGEFDQESIQPFWMDVENRLGNISQPPGGQLMADAGARLYNAIMCGDVQQLWARARGALLGPETVGLRIRLALYPPTVAALPWECLYDPDRSELFAANGRTPLVRVENQERYLSPPRPLDAKLPVKILLAAPEDPTGIINPAEASRTAEVLNRLGEDVAQTETMTGRFSLIDLSRKLADMQADVLHLITHGEPDGVLLWQDDEPAFMPAHTLRIALERAQTVKFVLLNACLAGQSSDRIPFTTVGPQLLQTGIPAVVAMQYEISDEDAAEFAQFLYEELLLGPCPGHIDAAVGYARSNLYVSHPDRFSFGTPVLWLNARDGQIFQLDEAIQNSATEFKSTHEQPSSYPENRSEGRPTAVQLPDATADTGGAPNNDTSSGGGDPSKDRNLANVLNTYKHWLATRRSEVERHQESEAWKVLHFTWTSSTNELDNVIRHIEKELADDSVTDAQISADFKRAEKLQMKIGNLAQAICSELTNDVPMDTHTDDTV